MKIEKQNIEPTVRIKLEWFSMLFVDCRYQYVKDDEAVKDARECPRSYVVIYGCGNVWKVLPKFNRFGDLRTSWTDRYIGGGSVPHKIHFTLLP